MNIQILDSWLREYIKTDAKPKDIATSLSLSSVSVERLEKLEDDYLYDIEVTTNRVDLMSVIGLSRELSAVLPQYGFKTEFSDLSRIIKSVRQNGLIDIQTDKSLVNRVTAAVLEVTIDNSPEFIRNRLEKSNIRSLNNLIDITNYIMRETGHPAHVFDFDRLNTDKLIVRRSKRGERIITLDEKKHTLLGGDIVAEDKNGRIVDLLGIMGLENSVVTPETKKILLFLDNNNPKIIRKTSLSLGIRSEAAVLNEKGVDPNIISSTITKGIELYEKYANGKLLGEVIDIYPNKPIETTVVARIPKISSVIGIEIDRKTVISILSALSFKVNSTGEKLNIEVPSHRAQDIVIEEDIIEEVARIYGYNKIPSSLPPIAEKALTNIQDSTFYWENRAKNAFKYWGFQEVYTYSMVSENLFEGPPETAVKIANPLSEEHIYMRNTLVPSLLEVSRNNQTDSLMIFELANVYAKQKNNLPDEKLHLAGLLKKESKSLFFELKGIIEQLLKDLGVNEFEFRKRMGGGSGADIYIGGKTLGNIELLEDNLVDFELDFEQLTSYAHLNKAYSPIAEYPPVIENLRIEMETSIAYEKIISLIESADPMVTIVELIDEYENKKTFRITYQDSTKTLSNEDVAPIREKIISTLEKELEIEVV